MSDTASEPEVIEPTEPTELPTSTDGEASAETVVEAAAPASSMSRVRIYHAIPPTELGEVYNPRREGTKGWFSMSYIIEAGDDGIAYDDFKNAGGRAVDLAWDYAHGYVFMTENKPMDETTAELLSEARAATGKNKKPATIASTKEAKPVVTAEERAAAILAKEQDRITKLNEREALRAQKLAERLEAAKAQVASNAEARAAKHAAKAEEIAAKRLAREEARQAKEAAAAEKAAAAALKAEETAKKQAAVAAAMVETARLNAEKEAAKAANGANGTGDHDMNTTAAPKKGRKPKEQTAEAVVSDAAD